MIRVTLPHRGTDDFGSGAYQASRGDRNHKGIDYEGPVGALVHAPTSGEVTKLGYVYSSTKKFRYVEITDRSGLRHRLFYVKPLVKKGDIVKFDQIVGEVQNIAKHHSTAKKKMKNHIHYEILKGNAPVNPEPK